MKKYTAMGILFNALSFALLFSSINLNLWIGTVFLYICGLLIGMNFGEAISNKKQKSNNPCQPK